MLSPVRLLAALIVVWLLARWRLPRLPRWARALLVAFACVLIALTTPFGANLLLRMQEARAPLATDCAAPLPTTIVLLSAGLDTPPRDVDDDAALDVSGLRRLLAAVALYRATPDARLVIVGSSGYAISDSRILAGLARRLGVADAALRVETDSLTTWENAQAAAAIVPPLPRRIWLVTSLLHMPRAFDTFRRAGFAPCAWAAKSQYHAPDGVGYFLPLGSAAWKAEQALHEIVGDAAYRLRADPPARVTP